MFFQGCVYIFILAISFSFVVSAFTSLWEDLLNRLKVTFFITFLIQMFSSKKRYQIAGGT